MVDILIPLGNGSISNNDELKLALRSIDKYTDVNKVYVITTEHVPWLTNVTIVNVPDTYKHNKDKNLITKIVRTLEYYPEIEDFAFWTDDNIITKPTKLAELPNVYNVRGLDYFKNIENRSKWQNRLYNTLTILKLLRYDVSCNWDAHTPALYNSKKILDGIKTIDWEGSAGNYTISTLFAYLCGYKKENAIAQDAIKYTYEQPPANVKFDRLFIGFNDRGFLGKLREELFNEFKTPSKYEEVVYNGSNKIGILAKNVNDNNIDKFLNTVNIPSVIFALDTVSYNTIKKTNRPVCYIPCYDTVTLNCFKLAIDIARCLVGYCVVIDGNYNYPVNYISSNISNLYDGVTLCITNALESFNSMLFNPLYIDSSLIDSDNIELNNIGAFLIDKGVRPVVIVNNAT